VQIHEESVPCRAIFNGGTASVGRIAGASWGQHLCRFLPTTKDPSFPLATGRFRPKTETVFG
jgi:hypothetical protein